MYVYQLSWYLNKIEKHFFFGLKYGKFFIEGSSVQLKEKILVLISHLSEMSGKLFSFYIVSILAMKPVVSWRLCFLWLLKILLPILKIRLMQLFCNYLPKRIFIAK